MARTVGVSLFLGPLALFWTSSLGGFYVAEAGAKVLQLHYLVPGMRTEVPLADVVTVEARPWYRGRWRLHVSTRTGQRFESATWHREAVIDAAARLNGIMNGE